MARKDDRIVIGNNYDITIYDYKNYIDIYGEHTSISVKNELIEELSDALAKIAKQRQQNLGGSGE